MKKKLSLLMIVFMAVAAFAIQVGKRASATTWTVAGNSTELFGSAWDPTATANDMTLDGDVYKWTKTDVALPAFTKVQFKVCGDHAWTVAFPAENYEFTIPENGKYTVVITFNAATEEITATATKTGDATFPDAEITKAQICGATDASWTNRIDFDLTKGEGNVYTGVLDASAYEDDVEFKLVVNGDTWIGFDQLTMNAPDGWVEKPEGNDNFLLKNSSTRYKSYNITATWVSNALANKGWTVKIEGKEPRTKDVTISPASGDISEAINAELGTEYFAKNVTINLVENGAYTISESITAGGNIAINGAEGATIDASALKVPFIQLSDAPTGSKNDKDAYLVDAVTIKDVKITDVKYQLVYGNKQKYLIGKLSIDNSVIAIDGSGKKTIIDFNGGGNASEIVINNSTIYANPTNDLNGGLFSSQSGHGSIQDLGSEKQLFAITNSTIYNVAYGKTTSSQRRNNTAGMEYKIENSIIVNSGKNGQFIVGLNGGSANAAQTYTVSNSSFNFDGADVSEAEAAKVQEKVSAFTMTSVAGVVVFKDAANGDFTLGDCAQYTAKIGDPRWALDKTALQTEITNATTLLGDASTEAGTPGADLKAAIDKAQSDFASATTQDAIDAAVTALQAAEEAYKTATGINAISVDGVSGDIFSDGKPVYNLSGQRVFKGYKGIVIKNGKKVMIK